MEEEKLRATNLLEDAEDKIKDLERQIEQLHATQQTQQPGEPPSPLIKSSISSTVQAEMHSLKKQIVRLKNENLQLRSAADGVDDTDVENKQHLVDHLKRKQTELVKENRRLIREIADLKANNSAPTIEPTPTTSGSNKQLEDNLRTYKGQIASKQKELEKITAEKGKMETYARKLLERLHAVKAERKALKTKYALGLETLNKKIQAQSAAAEAQMLAHKREQKLFQSAFYNIGREMAPGLLQEAAANRLRTPGQKQTTGTAGIAWLSRKRNEMRR